MRFLFSLIIPAFLIVAGCGNNAGKAKNGEGDSLNLAGNLKISGSETLYPMMAKWVATFTKEHPKVKIEVKPRHSEEGLQDLMNGKADIAMMSRKPADTGSEKNLWYTAVALDGLVAVINFGNPEIQPLVMHGISKEELINIFSGKTKNWGQVSQRACNEPVKAYVFPETSGTAEVWNQFLGITPASSGVTKVSFVNELMEHIVSEKGAIGYCSIRDAYDLTTGFRKEGVYVVPVDYNGNNTVEDQEQYYDKYSLVANAVSTGKMPEPPARELYLVTRGKPGSDLMKAFIKWVLTIGQNYTPAAGYINITPQYANAAVETMK